MGLGNYLFGWRRLNIHRGDLVLEVGSGGHPFIRSDVLCDMFPQDNIERGQSILIDRPFVCADAERLPFRNQTFDFLITYHTVEHLIHPEHFFAEAMRVSRAGLFVTPSEFCEKVIPQAKHLWLISIKEDGVYLLKQKKQANEADIPYFFGKAHETDHHFRSFFTGRPDIFQVNFAWDNPFNYEINRQIEGKPDWLIKAQMENSEANIPAMSYFARKKTYIDNGPLKRIARVWLSRWIRTIYSKSVYTNLDDLLVCPVCHGYLIKKAPFYQCSCGRKYPIKNNVPILLADTV